MKTLLFSRIARRYDFANRVLSLGLDTLWRRTLLEEILKFQPSPERFLDIACGSGDILSLAKDYFPKGVKFIGLDPCGEMLKIAQKRLDNSCPLIKGRAENLPLKSKTFDIVTVAFGVRNFEDRQRGLSEIYRVLKGGGLLGILEFSPPGDGNGNTIENIGWWYTKRLVPLLGGVITGNREAYRYLAESIERFPTPALFLKELKGIGFIPLKVKKFLPSPAVLYILGKPSGG